MHNSIYRLTAMNIRDCILKLTGTLGDNNNNHNHITIAGSYILLNATFTAASNQCQYYPWSLGSINPRV
jgi:hypothetical protein